MDFGLVMDAVFGTFGQAVVLDPDGLAVAATAIVRRPDADPEFQAIRTRVRTVTLELRASDLSALDGFGDGDVIGMADGERRTVKGPLRYADPDRLVALVDTVAE